MNWTVVLVVAIVVAGGVYALRFAGRRLTAEIGAVKLVVDDVNRAVNHRPAGSPTLYQLAEQAAGTAEAVTSLEGKVDRAIADDQAAHVRLDERLDGIEGRLR